MKLALPQERILISSTSFIDFISKSGTPKLTAVTKIKRQYADPYARFEDYYRKFRAAVVEHHRTGTSTASLERLVALIPDKNKRANYSHMADGYQKFWGRAFGSSDVTWLQPPKASWRHGRLIVRVNPELGFYHEDQIHIVKMYCKKDPLTREQAQLILHLLQLGLEDATEGCEVGLLDVREGRLFRAKERRPELTPLLTGEALSFTQMYSTINL